MRSPADATSMSSQAGHHAGPRVRRPTQDRPPRTLSSPPPQPTAGRWVYVTGCFRALGYDFAVRTTDPLLGQWLDELFGSLTVEAEPTSIYSFVTDASGPRPFAVYADDEALTHTQQPSLALRFLAWHVNRQAAARGTELVVVHAAGAERDGVGVLLPAASGCGKSTLVAGLVCSGFRYLSDEAVGIHPARLLLEAFPKPIALRPGSWAPLADLRPNLGDHLAPYCTEEWLVPPGAIRSGAVAPPTPARLVVFPRYEAGAPTVLEPLPRVAAVQELAEQTFEFRTAGAHNLSVLADLVRSAACFRLVVGDLATACALVHDVVDDLLERKVGNAG